MRQSEFKVATVYERLSLTQYQFRNSVNIAKNKGPWKGNTLAESQYAPVRK
jgi:hypothetical protein